MQEKEGRRLKTLKELSGNWETKAADLHRKGGGQIRDPQHRGEAVKAAEEKDLKKLGQKTIKA